jgi:peptidoglycan pentaglycine glycine transferase (the first glycine)
MPELSASDWNLFLKNFPNAHLLQTAPWGELKASFGWLPVRIGVFNNDQPAAGAQILIRRLPLGFSFAYIPKGPLFSPSLPFPDGWQRLLSEVDAACRSRRAVFLKVEHDLWENEQLPVLPGFTASSQSIQPRRTIVVDISGSDEELLSIMKQKTRYNIKLALKKEIIVHPSADLEGFYRLIQATGGRDQFGVHRPEYYRRVYELFHPRGMAELLVASYKTEPLAGLMVFAHGERAWYLYGASASTHRDRMPSYLLQWEAMRWARGHGCQEYDLWGVPDEDETTLETYFADRRDGLWGVYRFKRGFGGRLCRSFGPWDRVYNPALYALYKLWSKQRDSE